MKDKGQPIPEISKISVEIFIIANSMLMWLFPGKPSVSPDRHSTNCPRHHLGSFFSVILFFLDEKVLLSSASLDPHDLITWIEARHWIRRKWKWVNQISSKGLRRQIQWIHPHHHLPRGRSARSYRRIGACQNATWRELISNGTFNTWRSWEPLRNGSRLRVVRPAF